MNLVKEIEEAFERDPNQPLGAFVLRLRQDPEYHELAVLRILGGDMGSGSFGKGAEAVLPGAGKQRGCITDGYLGGNRCFKIAFKAEKLVLRPLAWLLAESIAELESFESFEALVRELESLPVPGSGSGAPGKGAEEPVLEGFEDRGAAILLGAGGLEGVPGADGPVEPWRFMAACAGELHAFLGGEKVLVIHPSGHFTPAGRKLLRSLLDPDVLCAVRRLEAVPCQACRHAGPHCPGDCRAPLYTGWEPDEEAP